MNCLIKWCALLALLVPMLASADPVVVNASTQGTLQVDDVWYGKLTGDNSVLYSQPMAFTFTLSGEFDPASSGFYSTTSGDVRSAYQLDPESVMTLTLDGKTYTATGGLLLMLSLQPQRLEVELIFTDLSHDFTMSLTFLDPAGGFDGDPLSTRAFASNGGAASYFESTATPHNPDLAGIWTSDGYPATASISISAIPEPNHAAMLLAGLFVIALARGQRMKNG